nr:hypothetical protein [Tanacetum cinerariifolium]
MSSSENDSLSLEEKSSSASKRRLEKAVNSSQAGTSHSLLDKSSNSLGFGTRFSTLDFMNSSDFVFRIVSRCSPPFLESLRASELPEPCYNQSFNDNAYPHDSPGVTLHIDHHCCYKCGDSLDGFFYHQCTCEFCGNGAHYGYNCPSHVPFIKTLPSVPQHYLCCESCGGHHETFQCSLRMGDEHRDTIPEKESNEFIKSSVKNLVPNPSESEDLSNIGSECDVSVCEDFTTFSNSLFDADEKFSSSDDESFSDEDVSKEIYSNPLFDEELISTKIDPHHFNVKSDLIESLLNRDTSIVSSPNDETDFDPEEEIRFVERLLYNNSSLRSPKELNSENSNAIIESFSPSLIPVEDNDSLMEEIDLSLTPDDSMPPSDENDDYDSEGDILFLEEFLSNDSLSLPENESFHFDIPLSLRPPAKPPDDDGIYFDDEPVTRIFTVKVVGDISEHYVLMPRLLPTQPTLCLVIDTVLPFSSKNKNTVHLLSHRGFKAFQFSSESPMMIYGGNVPILEVPFLHFYPP